MWAGHLGYQNIAVMLVRRGAHALLVDEYGRTAIDLAMESDQTQLALALLPEIFLCDAPGVSLLASIAISAAAMASVRQLHYRDADRAAKLEDISARSQLTAAALLRSLGTAEHDLLLRSRRGTVALLRAAQTGCHIILGRPRMQHSLHTAWAGRLFTMPLDVL